MNNKCYLCRTKEGAMQPQMRLRVFLKQVKVAGVTKKVCQFCVPNNRSRYNQFSK